MEIFDDGLKQIMGYRYEDSEIPTHMPVMVVTHHNTDNAAVNTANAEVNTDNAQVNTEKRVKRIAEDCSDCPFTKKRSLFDRLWDLTQWIGICGGISMLMWWFWMNGMMDMEAAFPCILLSGCIGCFGGGMSFKK